MTMILNRTRTTVTIGTQAFDLLVDRAQRYKAFAEVLISAIGDTFPDAAEVARRQLHELKGELKDE